MKWDLLKAEVAEHPYPLVFATVSGAHLYGFPSPDSDYDLRGVHLLPVPEVVGLMDKQETITSAHIREGVEVDLVTHDALKFFQMLLKRNGYVLEQLFSPLIVHAIPEYEELKAIASGCITRHHAHHYFGFATTQWGVFEKENPPKVKPLLYVYRVLLTGIHLMNTGIVEANLMMLNETFKLPYISELVARKMSGPEKAALEGAEVDFHAREYQRIVSMLEDAAAQSRLPSEPTMRAQLNDLLIRLRLANP